MLVLQGYDLELDKPTAAGTPLFVVQEDPCPRPAPSHDEGSASVKTSEVDVPAAGTSPREVQGIPRPRQTSDTNHMAPAEGPAARRRAVPTKPAFLIDDQTREVKVETYTERNK